MKEQTTENEDLRRVVKWISENILEDPSLPVQSLVEEAIFRFDLSPKDAEFLIGFYREAKVANG